MKRLFALFFIVCILLSGCTSDNNKNNIEDTSLIRIFGVDFKDGIYTVTILYNNSASSADEQTFKSLYGTGKSIFSAYDNMRQKSEQYPSLSQIKYFIVGKGAAENGIKTLVDFAVRHEQIKTDVQVMTTTDKTAKELIEENKDKDAFLGDTLQTSEHKEMKTVKHIDSTILGLQKHFTTEKQEFLVINLNTDENIYIDGYSVFSSGKMVDTLDYDTALGVDFMLGNIRSVPVYTNDFSAIITDIRAKKKVNISGDKLSYKIKTDFSTAIREITSDNLNGNIESLEKAQNEYVNSLIEKAVLYIKKSGYDIIDLGTLFNAYYPKIWADIKDNFDIKKVEFLIETNSKISKTFNLELMGAV